MAQAGPATVERLVGMVRLAYTALSAVTQAVLGPGGPEAERCLADAEPALKTLHQELEDDASVLLAGRRPVPRDLRSVVTETHVEGDVQQLTELARQIGEIAWVRRFGAPLPERVAEALRGMAELALGMLADAADALEDPQPKTVADLHGGLNEIGQRQWLLYGVLLADGTPVDRSDAVDAVLLARCYERSAGHALSAARHAGLFVLPAT